MNQGRIWTVVKPTVGLPLLLGSVTLMSFTIHFAVLNHTTWMGDYWQGKKIKAAQADSDPAAATPNAAGFVVSVAPAGVSDKGATSFVVTVAPGASTPVAVETSTARPPDKVASAETQSR